MRRFRALLTLTLAGPTLAALIAFTLLLAYYLWQSAGSSVELVVTDFQDGSAQLQVIEHPITALGGLLFAVVFAVVTAANVGLAYLLRRAWRSLRIRT